MKIFLLGAGKPAFGNKPSALKQISFSTTFLDWIINSFKSFASQKNIHFLGGYYIDEIIKKYPKLNFTLVTNWGKNSILNTLFHANFPDSEILISYTDTIFRNNVIDEIIKSKADIVYGVDSQWTNRYKSRSVKDMEVAEKVQIAGQIFEFTGLIYLSRKVVKRLCSLNYKKVGRNLIDLISFLNNENYTSKPIDINGAWAELNSPDDLAKFILGTKADTLFRLKPLISKSFIGNQVTFTLNEWNADKKTIFKRLKSTFKNNKLIVRSSSLIEDNWSKSNAGGFDSVLGVSNSNQKDVYDAVNKVIKSYGLSQTGNDQVLIQALLKDVIFSGVVLTSGLDTGGPYYKFNFDDVSKSTETVTSGAYSDLRTIIISRFHLKHLQKIEPKLVAVLNAVLELERLLNFDKLDIEFAVDKNKKVHIFQVRPITVKHSGFDIDLKLLKSQITHAKQFFNSQKITSPFIFGSKAIFANMPDWNPAEIIGSHPKPLSFSLYRKLITDDIWSKQRKEFGYSYVSNCPLVISLAGQPYVDVKASFNSFIPDDLNDKLKCKLADAYLNILNKNPQYHDKIEFEIAFTIWTPDFLNTAKKRLSPYKINFNEIIAIGESLKKITKNSFLRLNKDTNSIFQLEKRRKKTLNSSISQINKILILIDDCKKYGTLAFAHAARAGFVASAILKNLTDNNILTKKRKSEFFMSFRTVTGEFENDKYLYSKKKLRLSSLIKSYGHLRPGTYELGNQAYWENPKKYFYSNAINKPKKLIKFKFNKKEANYIQRILEEIDALISIDDFHNYLVEAIQKRESIKFEFTKNLSMVLDLLIDFGSKFNIKREDLSFLEYSDLEQLKINVLSIDDLKVSIKNRKKSFINSNLIELPSLITKISDFYCFERFSSEPNFITQKKVESQITELKSNKYDDIAGNIILIPQADPGYDWLFSYKIKGLITKYGGSNSHMAIRSAEIGLPSVIGVGEKIYEKLVMAKIVEIDCLGKTIREII